MYLGSDFHRFWARSAGDDKTHPDDLPHLSAVPGLFSDRNPPCPFDGPLERARVVVCLANPSYPEGDFSELILDQRSGEDPLPKEWDYYYEPRISRPIGWPMDRLRTVVSVFNVCPYPSRQLDAAAQRVVAGLPSVWQAQAYLRQVLIPRARTGNIFLIVLRKHQLWGLTEGDTSRNLRLVRGSELSGSIPAAVGREIRLWLEKKAAIFSGIESHLKPRADQS